MIFQQQWYIKSLDANENAVLPLYLVCGMTILLGKEKKKKKKKILLWILGVI
jgi:hypothetical protein